MSRVCSFCVARNAHKLCAGCKTTYYCDPTCQNNDWKEHKLVCKKDYLATNNPISQTFVQDDGPVPTISQEKNEELYRLAVDAGAFEKTAVRLGHNVKLAMDPKRGYIVNVKGFPEYVLGRVEHLESIVIAINVIMKKHDKPINGHDAIMKLMRTMWFIMGSPDPLRFLEAKDQ